ncbi:hypothetical protein Tco_0105465 [Tanacetum coccineum]
MLAPGSYVQWKSRIKRYIDTKPNHELIHYCLEHSPYKLKWAERTIPVAEGSLETTTEGIDNDIYSTVDACPNAMEMWKAIERLKQGESINVQDLETKLYWEFGKFTSRDGESLESYYLRMAKNEVNEIRAERLSHTTNPLALVAQQQPVYHSQTHPTHYTQNSSTRSQQAAIGNKGKAIVNYPPPIYDQEPNMVTKDDALSKEKEIDKLMALISLSFKKIYKPTNNNLRTSSNTSIKNQNNTLRINRGTRYDNQRAVNVVGARENVAREFQKPKRVKDAAYHKEKMLLCKQEEAGVQLSAEQVDWRDDTDDEPEDQELEAHYLYMAQIQEVTSYAADNSGPIFDAEPLQKVQHNDDYNVFANDRQHHEQPESVNDKYPDEQGDNNIIIDSLDMSTNGDQADHDNNDLARERNLLASLVEKLKCEIDDNKNRNKFLESSNQTLVDKLKSEIECFKNKNKCLESSNNHYKEANTELAKNNQLMFKDCWEIYCKRLNTGSITVKSGRISNSDMENFQREENFNKKVWSKFTILPPVTAVEIQADDAIRNLGAISNIEFGGSEGLEKGYDRFQQLLSQLEAHGAEVSTKDANHKFLRSLPPSWSNLAMTMRTKPDVDTLSIDDLYNNLMVFELEIQEDWDLLHEDLEQIDDLDIEEMDINWQIAMIAIRMKKFYKKTGRRVRVDGKAPVGFNKKKLECFNYHNTGHFARECTTKGIHDGKKKRDSFYQHQEAGKQEKNQMGLLTMDDGIVNWGEHAEDEETNHALMAISSSSEVSLCSKTCIDSYNTLKTLCDEQMNQLGDQEAQILAYSQAVKKLEAQLVTFQKQQLSLNEKLTFQANEIYEKDEKLKKYRRIGMKAVKEKEQLQKTLDSWKDSSKNLWRLINSSMSSNSKVGLGYEIQSNNEVLSYEEEMNFSVFNCSEEDLVGKPLYSRFIKTNDFKGIPHPLSGDYTPTPQEEIDDSLYVYVQDPIGTSSEHSFDPEFEISRVPQEVYVSTPITINKKGVSAPKSKEVEPSCVSHLKTPRQPIKDQETPKVNRKNWNAMMERELGEGYSFTKKKCFVCGSLSHLIKDCDYYEKKMEKESEVKKQRVCNTSNMMAKLVWTNINRINHANQFVPRPVQLNSGRTNINSVRTNINTASTYQDIKQF